MRKQENIIPQITLMNLYFLAGGYPYMRIPNKQPWQEDFDNMTVSSAFCCSWTSKGFLYTRS